MIYMIGGTIVGIVLGLLVFQFVPQKSLGWAVLALGAIALTFIIPVLVSILFPFDVSFVPVLSMPFGLAGLIAGIGSALKGYRPWQVWFGLAFGAIPILFWFLFAIGELLYPH